jgi:hypothetical protein
MTIPNDFRGTSKKRDNEGMIVPRGVVHRAQLADAVQRAEAALRPDVVRIRYSLDEDWSGTEALFFRIVLTDKASRQDRLRDVARRVSDTITKEVQPGDFGLQAYFNFRSQSEEEGLKEPAWA